MPHTKFDSNRLVTFGDEDVFVKRQQTDVRTAGYRTHFIRLSRKDRDDQEDYDTTSLRSHWIISTYKDIQR